MHLLPRYAYSLVYKAMQVPEYQHHLAAALAQDRERATRTAGGGGGSRPYAGVADVLAVNLGAEMLKLVPGRVSTEVDAHLSFDTQVR